MEMKIRTLEFDGTPEEFSKVSHMFSGSSGGSSAAQASLPEAVGAEANLPKEPITPQVILRVLNRRPLSPNVRRVLKTLLKAGPPGLTTAEISKAVGLSRAELAGVFGAFGRRVANTPGWPEGAYFSEFARDENDETLWRYWLPQAFHDVIDSGKFKL